MIRISVWPGDFSDSYLRHVTQLVLQRDFVRDRPGA